MRRIVLLPVSMLVAWVAGSATAAPLCEVDLSLTPMHAVVGQQIHYRLRILRAEGVQRSDWATPLSFPALRAEWLPSRAENEPVMRNGVLYRASIERRALFASRAGTAVVPGAGLRCTDAEGKAQLVPIPDARVEVAAPPIAARPERFEGLVGPVELRVLLAPASISLGETARLVLSAAGAGNVWRFGDPRADLAGLADVEILPREPTLQKQPADVLRLRRSWSYDLVPRRAGAFTVPAVTVAYFDPDTGSYRTARTEPQTLSVGPRAEAAPTAAGPASTALDPGPDAGEPRDRSAWVAAAVAALTALIGWGIWRAVSVDSTARTGRNASRPANPTPRETPRSAKTTPRRSTPAESDAGAPRAKDALSHTAYALRAALSPVIPDAGALSVEELRQHARPEGAAWDAVELLGEIERARFAGDGRAGPEDERVRRAIDALRAER